MFEEGEEEMMSPMPILTNERDPQQVLIKRLVSLVNYYETYYYYFMVVMVAVKLTDI